MYEIYWNLYFPCHIYILSILMCIQNLIKIHKFIPKILSIKKFWCQDSVKHQPKITCFRYNMNLVFINAFPKFIQIHPFVLKILKKNTFLHQSRAITLLFINKFRPFAIPNHSSPISMYMQNLKKISQKLLKLQSVNEVLKDGQMHGQTDTQNGSESIT